MIDGRRNRKDFMSIVYETYKDFAENTSIHGLKYTVKSGIAIYERIFWIVVILGGLGGAGYMTVLFWSRFTSNPTRTSIQTAYAPTTSVPFPAVTICNINRIMVNKVDDFIKRLNMEEDQSEIVRRAFPQLLAFTNPTAREYNMTELTILHQVLMKNDYSDVNLIMRKVSQSCEEMLIKCRWNFTNVPCNEIFEETYSNDGQCCSFNYVREYLKDPRKPKSTPHFGLHSGLVLLLNPMIQPVQYSSLHSTGLKVIIHSSTDYPGGGSIYKIVSAGKQTFLQVSASKIVASTEFRSLPMEQTKCAYPEELSLKYFPTYADTNCLTECEANYYYRKCRCVPFYYPFTDKPICNITRIPCLDETKGANAVSRVCNCPSQCEDEFYNVMSTTIKLSYNDVHVTSSFLMNANLTSDTIFLYVYFSSQRQTILYRDILTSTIYLLSSFGGVYGLFLGCSFISIVEIIYYCSFRLIVNLKILGRIDKSPLMHLHIANKEDKVVERTPKFREHIKGGKDLRLWTYDRNIFLH